MKRIGGMALAVAAAMATPAAAQQAAQEAGQRQEDYGHQFYWTNGFSMDDGDYGTNDDTTFMKLFTDFLWRWPAQGEVGLMIPYLFRDDGRVTPGETTVVRRNAPREADGIGDILLYGSFFLMPEDMDRPGVDLTGSLKLPTADESEGLGTGGLDLSVGAEVYKSLENAVLVFGNADLVFRDAPADVNAVRFDYAAGTGYPFTDTFAGYVSLEGSTPSSSGDDAPLEGVLTATYDTSETTQVYGYLLLGLTDSAPDWGLGTGVSLRF